VVGLSRPERENPQARTLDLQTLHWKGFQAEVTGSGPGQKGEVLHRYHQELLVPVTHKKSMLQRLSSCIAHFR